MSKDVPLLAGWMADGIFVAGVGFRSAPRKAQQNDKRRALIQTINKIDIFWLILVFSRFTWSVSVPRAGNRRCRRNPGPNTALLWHVGLFYERARIRKMAYAICL